MTVSEMYTEFLIRKDKISSSSTKGYEASEVSSFLTKAQLDLTKAYCKLFETSEYARKALSKLVMNPYAKDFQDDRLLGRPIDISTLDNDFTAVDWLVDTTNGKLFKLPEDVMKVIWESVLVDGTNYDVIPITHDEYHRVKRNKFRYANTRKALRLDTSGFEIIEDGNDNTIRTETDQTFHEIICTAFPSATSIQYNMRYIKVPNDIIYSEVTEEQQGSYLADFIHDEIVDLAVAYALENSEEITRLQTFSQLNSQTK